MQRVTFKTLVIVLEIRQQSTSNRQKQSLSRQGSLTPSKRAYVLRFDENIIMTKQKKETDEVNWHEGNNTADGTPVITQAL